MEEAELKYFEAVREWARVALLVIEHLEKVKE
jgi:hypothetical protein